MNTTAAPHPLEDNWVRYSRHIALAEIGVAGQKKLSAASVLIVGLGGLGTPAACYLAAAGVGTLGLTELDQVELSNLQRQILYREADLGSKKLDCVSQRLREANSQITIRTHPVGIQVSNARQILAEYDLIIDASDNFSTRYLVNDAAFLSGKAVMYGSLAGFDGQISCFAPHISGPCYRCLFPSMPKTDSIPNCAQTGVLGALCGVVGSLQALEAIKYLVGIGECLSGRLLAIEALSMRFRSIQVKRDPACPLCGECPAITDLQEEHYVSPCPCDAAGATDTVPMEVNVDQAKQRLSSATPPFLLDVREPFEAAICQIPGSTLIPMDKLAEQCVGLPQNGSILVYCHHGLRSLRAVCFLRQKGFLNTSSIAGGISQWAECHAPDMRRY